jgi:hypothetical protein|tara:strand:- start:108 stop:305 length:198 start_codon:yes stop_codon:yes gene_type:complete
MTNKIDMSEKIKRIIKYILNSLLVFLVARYLPCDKLKFKDTIIIGMMSSFIFAILDMYSPTLNIE